MIDYSSCNFEKQEVILIKYESVDYEISLLDAR